MDGLIYAGWLMVLIFAVIGVCCVFAVIRWLFFAAVGRYNDTHPTYTRPQEPQRRSHHEAHHA